MSACAQKGGAISISGGELRLLDVLIEDSVADNANVIFIDGDIQSQVLLVLTFVTVKQETCSGDLFVQNGEGQVVLHGFRVSFTACNPEGYNISTAFRGVVSKQCGDTYVGTDAMQHGVCASATASACTSQSLVGTRVVDLAW